MYDINLKQNNLQTKGTKYPYINEIKNKSLTPALELPKY